MKQLTLLISSLLLLGGGALAQDSQFPLPVTPETSLAVAATNAVPSNASAAKAVFGSPRSSSDGSLTRVVFDLLPGVTYTLTPTFSGLRLDVQGARVQPAVIARLGSSVSEYRAGGSQVTLTTPFPLSLSDGWRATEATLATGARVLILEFGPTLSGGASDSLRAAVRTSVPASTPPISSNPASSPVSAPSSTPVQPVQADTLPPGDTIAAPSAARPSPPLPGADSATPSALSGRVPGSSAAIDTTLLPPRLGKNPGVTRVVLDLPPGATYRIQPGGVGLRVELSGVKAAAQNAQNVSPEVRTWRYEPTPDGVTVTFVTGTPTSDRSGWRAMLLPPASGERFRLAIDLSPALANLTPLTDQEKVIAAVPPVPRASGLAILALGSSYAQPRVVIDPGHGGKDPGAVGSIVEKDVTLSVALRVRELLREAGVDVILTRETDTELNLSKNTDLEMRAALGNPGSGAQLFVSIHVNAMDPRNLLRGYGVETWWNTNHPLSANLAGILQSHLVTVTGAFNQGLKSSRSLSVLRNSRIPAALVEIGYTSHPVDGLNLQDSNYLERVAVAIARGVSEALVSGITADPLGPQGSSGKP